MLRSALFVLFIALCTGFAHANELISKSRSPTGWALTSAYGTMRHVDCFRTVRRIEGNLYVRERECPSPTEHLSDIATPLKQSGPSDVRRFKVLANGNIQLY